MSFSPDLLQACREFLNFLGLLGVQIVVLPRVVAEVVQLAWKFVLRIAICLIKPFGHFTDTTGFCGDEHPVTVAKSITVRICVVNHRITGTGGIPVDERGSSRNLVASNVWFEV